MHIRAAAADQAVAGDPFTSLAWRVRCTASYHRGYTHVCTDTWTDQDTQVPACWKHLHVRVTFTCIHVKIYTHGQKYAYQSLCAIYIPIYPPINILSSCLSVNVSVKQSIYLSIYLSIDLSIDLFIYRSIYITCLRFKTSTDSLIYIHTHMNLAT